MNEAANLILDGEPIDHIDKTLNLASCRPCGTLISGIDVGTKIIPFLVEAFGERFTAPSVDKVLADAEKVRRTRKGFILTKAKSQVKKWMNQSTNYLGYAFCQTKRKRSC